MSLMDWNPPTPRGSSFAQQAATDSPPRGRAGADLSPASAHPLTDWFAVACSIVAPQPDQNLVALAEAVRTYRQTYGRAAYEAMRDAAMRCGMPEGEPPLSWSRRRLENA